MTGPRLNIAWLYADLMSIYGDRGNVVCLVRRCQWRGIDVAVREIGASDFCTLENSTQDVIRALCWMH